MTIKLKQQRPLALILIILFALVGSYLIFQSKAATEDFLLVTGNISNQGGSVSIDLAIRNIPGGGPYHANIDASISGTQASHPYFTNCTVGNSCSVVQEQGGSQLYSGARGCVVLSQATAQQLIGKLTFKLVSSEAYKLDIAQTGVYRGSDCSNNSQIVASSTHQYYMVANGAAPTGAQCYQGLDTSGSGHCDGIIVADNSTPPYKNNQKSKSSSSANKTVQPTTSSQGEQQQPKVEPSPFVDGDKTYQPGSDPDTLGTSSTANVRSKVVKGRYVILPILFLIVVAGIGYWWWRQRRHGLPRK